MADALENLDYWDHFLVSGHHGGDPRKVLA
jgi:hypothetical protein